MRRSPKLTWRCKDAATGREREVYEDNGVLWTVERPAPSPRETYRDASGVRWTREVVVAAEPPAVRRPAGFGRRGRERRPGTRRSSRRSSSRGSPSDLGDDPEPARSTTAGSA